MSDNLYILRVRLSWARGVWREIAIRGNQTLADLHYSILEAFEWDDDDVYRIVISDDADDLKNHYASNSDMKPTAIRLDDLNLEEEQAFYYFFGAGDRNRFSVRVMMVDEADPYDDYPDVVDEMGDSPEQELAYLDD